MKKRFQLVIDLSLLTLCLLFAEQLLFNSFVVKEALQSALALCVETLIPSLFCFMVLTAFLSGTGLGKLLSLPLLPISRFLCLPPQCGYILLMSFVGGYPMGIKALKDALGQKQISKKLFHRMTLFCICPAPSFVIVAVGKNLLRNEAAGMILYCAQLLSLLFLGLITSITQEVGSKKEMYHFLKKTTSRSYSDAIVDAVNFASQTMLVMCGYMMIFSVVSALLCQILPENTAPFLSAALEIASGSAQLAEVPSSYRLAILSFFLSFGGFSVLFQLKSILGSVSCHFSWLLFGRLLHGSLSAFFTILLLQCAPQALGVFQSSGKPVPIADASTPILTLCLLGMLIIFLHSLENLPKKQNK